MNHRIYRIQIEEAHTLRQTDSVAHDNVPRLFQPSTPNRTIKIQVKETKPENIEVEIKESNKCCIVM